MADKTENPIKIAYSFNFETGPDKRVDIILDRQSLAFIPKESASPPSWTKLGHKKCGNCRLDEASNSYCPVAYNLADIAREFKDFFAYENAFVTVTTEERTYSKDTTLEVGLGSLLGIVMVTSGCPGMERLKPMVRFHLPFATLIETVYRMVSMYFVAQYFLKQEGISPDWDLEGLESIYLEVGLINGDFAARLSDAAKKDANVNSLVRLDFFAQMVPFQAEKVLEEIKAYFNAYTG
jgi:hypothetical protein